MQWLVNHSEARDQFLRVAVKRMMETQLFEDELKKVSQLNIVLLVKKLKHEAKLAEVTQAKDGKHSELILILSGNIQGATNGSWHCPR
jgi:hypothetical protein